MKTVFRSVILATTLAPCLAASQPATTAATGTLTVGGDVKDSLTLTPSDIKGMPRTTVTVSEEGREVKYEGVLVAEILKKAGVPLGREMSGGAVASYVLAGAKDGYQVVFSLAELDPGFTSNDIIIADTVDGKPLFDYQGPLRIVAPHDKRGARSIRMLQTLNVVRLRK
ncbi:MAG TPA: molybdopterin-dependent oxidoreductase [Vicinamibacterales bacterium]